LPVKPSLKMRQPENRMICSLLPVDASGFGLT